MTKPRNRWMWIGSMAPPLTSDNPANATAQNRAAERSFAIILAKVEAIEKAGKSVRCMARNGGLMFYVRKGGT